MDAEGTVRDYTVAAGGVWYVWHRDYNSYGVLVSGTIDTDMPYAYTGLFTDTATAMNFTASRVYDPQTQRGLTQDTVPADSNDYRYVGNDPWNATDPSGMFGQLVTVGSTDYGLGLGSYSLDSFSINQALLAPTVPIPPPSLEHF